MRSSPKAGDEFVFSFKVTEAKTVPALYPESAMFRAMPAVFATGFMVGLMEWACIEALAPHLDVGEGSLGIAINVDHTAPTLPGQVVTVTVTCDVADNNRFGWTVVARDEVDQIGKGRHDRAVVRWDGFNRRLDKKRGELAGL